MGKIKNKILDVSSVGFTDAIGAGTAGIFWFYLASQLGPENYGEITFLMSIATLTSGIALFGSNRTIWILSAKKIEIEKTIFVLVTITSTISAIVLFIFFSNIGLSFVTLSFVVLSLTIPGLLGRKKYRTYAKHMLVQKALMAILGIGLYFTLGEFGILIGIGLSYIHMIFPLVKIARKTKINFNLIKDRKEFMFNNFSLNVFAVLYGSLDKLIIAPMLGYAILGNYSLGLQFFQFIALLPHTATKYLIAQDATGVKNTKLKKIMIISSIVFAILGSTIGPTVATYVFPKFLEAEEVIRIISWGVIPLTIQSTHYIPKLWAQERNRIILYNTIIMTITQVLSILSLGSLYGTLGVAIAFLLSNTVSCVSIAVLDKITRT